MLIFATIYIRTAYTLTYQLIDKEEKFTDCIVYKEIIQIVNINSCNKR